MTHSLILRPQPPSDFTQTTMFIMESDKCTSLLRSVLLNVPHVMDTNPPNASPAPILED